MSQPHTRHRSAQSHATHRFPARQGMRDWGSICSTGSGRCAVPPCARALRLSRHNRAADARRSVLGFIKGGAFFAAGASRIPAQSAAAAPARILPDAVSTSLRNRPRLDKMRIAHGVFQRGHDGSATSARRGSAAIRTPCARRSIWQRTSRRRRSRRIDEFRRKPLPR